MGKNIQYSLLSLLSMVMIFLFLLLLGQHFGMGTKTDTYFLSTMIVTYLSYLITATWEAMHPYYIKLKVENPLSASQLYSLLLNGIVLLSLLIIALYFLLTNTLIHIEGNQKDFLNIYIFYILFQNILLFNKTILNLEKYFASYYLVDIFIYSINILIVISFLEEKITLIAYSMIIASSFAILWQFYLIFYKVNIKYHFQKTHQEMKSIYKNSLIVKFSSLLYGTKEPLFALIFLTLGEGLYSIFNYANKFSAAIFQVTTAPILNQFVTKVHYSVAHKKYAEIESRIKTILSETVPLFIISSVVFYLLIPYSMPFFFREVLTLDHIEKMQIFYLYMSLFYLIIVFESPYSSTLSIFKLFNYQLFINGIFFISLCGVYLLFKLDSLTYYTYLFIIILAQALNLFLYREKNRTYLKGKL